MWQPTILLLCVAAQVLLGAEARALGKGELWPPPPTCAFAPHAPPRYPTSPAAIPSSAWPLVRSLLTAHLLPAVRPDAFPRREEGAEEEGPSAASHEVPLVTYDSVRTLYLRDYTSPSSACASPAAELEPIVLGLVFTASALRPARPRPGAGADRELRRRGGDPAPRAGGGWRSCVEQALLAVERDRRGEGVLDLPGGRVSFLVWRAD
ncbi:unnamed protein product [Diplocarpon coronariae]|nr:hypothetical protein JHW43_008780 [Diplocarpon mali]